MGYDGSLKFDTSIIEKGFNDGITKLGSIAKTGIGVVTAALGTGLALGVKYNAEMQNYFSDFKVMLGSAEAATEYVNQLKEMAAKTPFEMTDLANASKILLAFGSTADTAQSQLKMLGDISLGNAEKMNTLSTAFGRIQSNGRASMEELNMMIDSGFNPLNIIAKQTGESMEELRKRVSDGGVSFEEIAEAMRIATSEGGQFYNGMQEASTTLTGQLSTLKDNVNNLLGEMTQGITDTLTNKLVPGAIEAVNELTTAFEEDGFTGVFQVGADMVSNILNGIVSKIPSLLETGGNLITSFLNSISANPERVFGIAGILIEQFGDGFVASIPVFLPKVLDLINGFGQKLAELAPIVIDQGFEMLSKLVEGITVALPILIAKVPEIISTFANIINDNFPTIILKGVQLIGQLIIGILQAIPTLVANIPKIIIAIVDVWEAFNWLSLGKNAMQFLKNGIEAMKASIKQTATNINDTIKNAILNLPSTLANLGKNAISKLGSAITGAKSYASTAISNISKSIINTISQLPDKMLSIGKDVVRGLWNGISNMTGWVIGKIQGFGESVLGGIKKFFGIKSPSRLMRDEVGKYMAQGVGVGFEKNVPVKQMTASMKKAIGDMQQAAIRVTSNIPMTAKIATKAVTNNYTDTRIDYDEIENAQLRAMNKANQRPVLLNGRQINRALNDGGYVTV